MSPGRVSLAGGAWIDVARQREDTPSYRNSIALSGARTISAGSWKRFAAVEVTLFFNVMLKVPMFSRMRSVAVGWASMPVRSYAADAASLMTDALERPVGLQLSVLAARVVGVMTPVRTSWPVSV